MLNKRNMKKILKLITTLLFIIIIAILSLTTKDNILVVKLNRCIDGDTASFITNNGSQTVRFLAIDTPETVSPTKPEEKYGKEASDFTCNALTNANKITLELDNNSDMYDKYKRLLAWVFVDNELLQSKLIDIGYAKVAYLYGNYKYTSILISKETEAKQKRLGIWYND